MTQAFPLVRNLSALRNQRFDLLVIGGGIYGAWTAFDASLRGLSVALIEKKDWGSGTSSASSKLIHGGLRYLEHYDFALVRHALGERRVLSTIAPHMVRPLRFVVPVHRGARVGMLMMEAGLTLYDFLSGFNQPVARHQRFSANKLATRHPYLRRDDLKGGFSYGDCQEDDARMTLHVVAAAQSAGAVCANGVSALALEEGSDGRILRARVRDEERSEEFTIEAEGYVTTAGPWSQQLLGERAPKLKLIKGVHLVLPAIPGNEEAFLLTAPQDGRVFFVIPWYGRTLVGTTEAEILDPREAVVKPEEQRYLLEAVNALLPGLRWTDEDVIASFAGARTLQAEETASLSAVTREFELLAPRPNLLLPIGGKYTTARSDSVDIVDRAMNMLDRTVVESATNRHALPGTPTVQFDAWYADACARLKAQDIDDEAAHWLALRHGTGIERIIEIVREEPESARRLHSQAPFLVAEAMLAVSDEMARSVDDVLRRRMPMRLLVGADQLARENVDACVEALLTRYS